MSLRQLVYQLPTNKVKYIFKYEIIDECSTTVNVPSLGHYPTCFPSLSMTGEGLMTLTFPLTPAGPGPTSVALKFYVFSTEIAIPLRLMLIPVFHPCWQGPQYDGKCSFYFKCYFFRTTPTNRDLREKAVCFPPRPHDTCFV